MIGSARLTILWLLRLAPALNVVSPSTPKVPSTSALFFIVVVPVAAPMLTFVPAPAKLTVDAVVLTRLKVVVETVKSPPSMLTSPSTSRSFLIFVVPVVAPMLTVVPAPAKLTVVADVLTRLKVAWFVVISPPLTAKF